MLTLKSLTVFGVPFDFLLFTFDLLSIYSFKFFFTHATFGFSSFVYLSPVAYFTCFKK